jgi:hypothetical protein
VIVTFLGHGGLQVMLKGPKDLTIVLIPGSPYRYSIGRGVHRIRKRKRRRIIRDRARGEEMSSKRSKHILRRVSRGCIGGLHG